MCTTCELDFHAFLLLTNWYKFSGGKRKDGLVVIMEVVEENAVVEFYAFVEKAEHQLGLKGVDRLAVFTRHELLK
jgi:hypothetical protein